MSTLISITSTQMLISMSPSRRMRPEEWMLIFRMAVKRLLRQTLSHDDEMIEVHSLAELILSEGVRLGAGSSIKTDGEESDPWGLVGVVDIAKHRVCPSFIHLYSPISFSLKHEPLPEATSTTANQYTRLMPLSFTKG